jgi:hypothetical protein
MEEKEAVSLFRCAQVCTSPLGLLELARIPKRLRTVIGQYRWAQGDSQDNRDFLAGQQRPLR